MEKESSLSNHLEKAALLKKRGGSSHVPVSVNDATSTKSELEFPDIHLLSTEEIFISTNSRPNGLTTSEVLHR